MPTNTTSAHFCLSWAKDEMDATLASIESKAGQMQAETRVKADQFIAEMKKKRDEFQSTVKKQAQARHGLTVPRATLLNPTHYLKANS